MTFPIGNNQCQHIQKRYKHQSVKYVKDIFSNNAVKELHNEMDDGTPIEIKVVDILASKYIANGVYPLVGSKNEGIVPVITEERGENIEAIDDTSYSQKKYSTKCLMF